MNAEHEMARKAGQGAASALEEANSALEAEHKLAASALEAELVLLKKQQAAALVAAAEEGEARMKDAGAAAERVVQDAKAQVRQAEHEVRMAAQMTAGREALLCTSNAAEATGKSMSIDVHTT
jgi:hypothetical protein